MREWGRILLGGAAFVAAGCSVLTTFDGFGQTTDSPSDRGDGTGPGSTVDSGEDEGAAGSPENVTDNDGGIVIIEEDGGSTDAGDGGSSTCTTKALDFRLATSRSKTGVGSPWAFDSRVLVLDDSYAQSTLSSVNPTSQLLSVTGFGFNVPAQAIVRGVEVRVYAKSNDGLVRDNDIVLLHNDLSFGSSRAKSSSWKSTRTIQTYGGLFDTWGAKLTPTIVNSASFGLGVRVTSPSPDRAYIDAITMRVSYCE